MNSPFDSVIMNSIVTIGWNAADALVFSERAPVEAGPDEGL